MYQSQVDLTASQARQKTRLSLLANGSPTCSFSYPRHGGKLPAGGYEKRLSGDGVEVTESARSCFFFVLDLDLFGLGVQAGWKALGYGG